MIHRKHQRERGILTRAQRRSAGVDGNSDLPAHWRSGRCSVPSPAVPTTTAVAASVAAVVLDQGVKLTATVVSSPSLAKARRRGR